MSALLLACSQTLQATPRCSSRLTLPRTPRKLQHSNSLCGADSNLSACLHALDSTRWSHAVRCQLCFPPLNLRNQICLQTLEIKVQPGWKDGTKITFPGKGDEVPGRPPADLVFVVKQLPHPLFERRGNDLHLKVTITLKQAIGGGCCPRVQGYACRSPCLSNL